MRKPNKLVNMGTFKIDHIIRSFTGVALGRVVLFDESSYTPGMDVINVSVLRIPFQNGQQVGVRGFQCYVDGVLYEVPNDLRNIHFSIKGDSTVATNVCLMRVDNGEEKQN